VGPIEVFPEMMREWFSTEEKYKKIISTSFKIHLECRRMKVNKT
jgi:hypothetical protein